MSGISYGGMLDVSAAGALGDGLTDDSAIIQRVVNEVSHNGGGTVYFPPGTYLAKFYVPANTDLVGDTATLKLPALSAGDGSPIVDVRGSRVTFRGLKFDGNKSAQTADGFSDSFNTGGGGTGRAYRAAIKVDGTTYSPIEKLLVENCEFVNTYGAAIAALNVDRVHILNNHFDGCNFEAAFLYVDSGQTNDEAVISGNVVRNVGSGHASVNGNCFVVTKYRRCSFTSNACYNFERNMVKFEHGVQIACIGNHAELNTVDSFGAIQTQGTCSKIVIADNVIKQCGAGITLNHNPAASAVTITGNVIEETLGPSQGDGILVGATALDEAVISGNVLRNILRMGVATSLGGSRLSISHNVIEGTGHTDQPAIYINGGGPTNQLSIIGNVIYDYPGAAGGVGVLRVLGAGANVNNHIVIQDNSIVVEDGTRTAIVLQSGSVPTGLLDNNYTNGVVSGAIGA